MRRHRWSIILAVSNILLAALLFSLGQREFRSLARSPGAFYEGSGGYIPTAQKISYCFNVPSLAVTAPLRNWLTGHVMVGGSWVTYGDIEYGVAVFLFWWWVGSRLDMLRADQRSRQPRSKLIVLAERLFGLLVSLVLLYGGVTGLLGKITMGSPLLIAMILWGLGILYYVAEQLHRDGRSVAKTSAPMSR